MLHKTIALVAVLAAVCQADLYMQACRGSNNRLDERGRDRANGNRLFNSQNNDRGGYNVGKLTYYSGEKVPISWTNQHSSGPYQLYGSELIIQYACGALMRDGTTTNRIPDNPRECYNYDCDTDVEYGRHESFTDYQYCKASQRNMGLFTANQNLRNRNGAIYTRQNPAGTRRGLECDEERDYYPYWRGSMWRDIHIFTNQVDRCGKYREHSQNVKSKRQCMFHEEYWKYVLKGYYNGPRGYLPLNETLCSEDYAPTFVSPKDNQTKPRYHMGDVPSHGVNPPGCSMATVTRTNHHGLTGGRNYWTYDWTVPDLTDDRHYSKDDYSTCCVVRMRYNITTNDYDAWESDSSINAGMDSEGNTNHIGNSSPDPDDDPANVAIWERFGLTYDDIRQAFETRNADDATQYQGRGYVFRNNPRVDPFGRSYTYNGGTQNRRVQLQLAINTNQFARTFEDRTHCFQIRDRPNSVSRNAEIHLMTVQGKRGNIVQVYPATEYFFIPEPLMVPVGDYVHFCWTGSNTNPNNNDGQGLQGSDRSNICPLTQQQYSKAEYSDTDGNRADIDAGAVGDLGNLYPDYVQWPDYKDDIPEWMPYAQMRGVPAKMAGFDTETIRELCTTRRVDDDDLLDFGNMEELDDSGTTVCLDPVRAESEGLWNFLCTRNNNFSNRSQKGSLRVLNGAYTRATVDSNGAKVRGRKGEAIAIVPKGMVEEGDTLELSLTTWNRPGKDSAIVELAGADGGEFSSATLTDGAWIELWVPYTPSSMATPVVYYKTADGTTWDRKDEATIDEDRGSQYAVINVKKGGYYRAKNEVSGWALVGLGVVLAAVGVTGAKIGMDKLKQ